MFAASPAFTGVAKFVTDPFDTTVDPVVRLVADIVLVVLTAPVAAMIPVLTLLDVTVPVAVRLPVPTVPVVEKLPAVTLPDTVRLVVEKLLRPVRFPPERLATPSVRVAPVTVLVVPIAPVADTIPVLTLLDVTVPVAVRLPVCVTPVVVRPPAVTVPVAVRLPVCVAPETVRDPVEKLVTPVRTPLLRLAVPSVTVAAVRVPLSVRLANPVRVPLTVRLDVPRVVMLPDVEDTVFAVRVPPQTTVPAPRVVQPMVPALEMFPPETERVPSVSEAPLIVPPTHRFFAVPRPPARTRDPVVVEVACVVSVRVRVPLRDWFPEVRRTVASTPIVAVPPRAMVAPPVRPCPFAIVTVFAESLDVWMGPVIFASVTAPVAIFALETPRFLISSVLLPEISI